MESELKSDDPTLSVEFMKANDACMEGGSMRRSSWPEGECVYWHEYDEPKKMTVHPLGEKPYTRTVGRWLHKRDVEGTITEYHATHEELAATDWVVVEESVSEILTSLPALMVNLEEELCVITQLTGATQVSIEIKVPALPLEGEITELQTKFGTVKFILDAGKSQMV